jgi:ketosteroid isomerase-like protein
MKFDTVLTVIEPNQGFESIVEIQHIINQENKDNMPFSQQRLQQLYESFNQRDVEVVLASLQPDVQWANGMGGGFVHGRDAVREHWLKQFQALRPHLVPQCFETDEQGRALVTLHQTVHDIDGNLLLEQDVQHRFTFRDGSIALFGIVNPNVQLTQTNGEPPHAH